MAWSRCMEGWPGRSFCFLSFSIPGQEGVEAPVGKNEGDFMVFPRLEGVPTKLFISRFCLSVQQLGVGSRPLPPLLTVPVISLASAPVPQASSPHWALIKAPPQPPRCQSLCVLWLVPPHPECVLPGHTARSFSSVQNLRWLPRSYLFIH